MKQGWKLPRITLLAAIALNASAPVSAQTSPTCESAIAALLALRIALEGEKAEHRRCMKSGRTTCTAEEGRVRELELQNKLVRNYLERYCSR